MTFHYSKAFETLIEALLETRKESQLDAPQPPSSLLTTARVVIIGSGYGGSVAALRLAEPERRDAAHQHDVMVLERGREYALGDFPTDLAELPTSLSVRSSQTANDQGNPEALFDLRIGKNVDVLVGSGLGGGSLINANVAIEPELSVFTEDQWPQHFRTPTGQQSLRAAFDAVKLWLDVPQPGQLHRLKETRKYQALGKLAHKVGLHVEPAPINIALDDRTNHAGVHQRACTHCGNCVSGCNVGAKSTLAMNLIPAAVARGAEFFTGALVYSIERDAAKQVWRVHVRPTSKLTRARFPARYYIETPNVILAAGTLGSTEILGRSMLVHGLKCSSTLGERFSTNGDGIAASFCEEHPVNAIGSKDFLQPDVPTGPTITACARPKTGPHKFLLEDGSIPAAMSEIYGEIMTTAAQFGRLGYNRLPAWLRRHPAQPDPLAVHREAQNHGQVFLMMCDDKARGRLCFEGNCDEEPESGGIVPTWEPHGLHSAKMKGDEQVKPNNAALAHVSDLLATQDREDGLSGGQYIHNPLWRLLPESASSVMAGAFPGDRLLTVHPLGGCRMADGGEQGVVNHNGEVFDGDGTTTHPGLRVLDGSILPGALGVNPFLTIAALAWRACDEAATPLQTVKVKQPLEPPTSVPAPVLPEHAAIVIREQLIGALPATLSQQDKQRLRQLFPKCDQWFERDRLVLRIESDPASTEIALRGHGTNGAGQTTQRVRVRAQLYLSPVRGDHARRWKCYGISSERLGKTLIAEGEGTMTILEIDRPNSAPGQDLWQRRREALYAYAERRSGKWLRPLWKAISYFSTIGDAPRPVERIDRSVVGGWLRKLFIVRSWLRKLRGFLSIAEMHSSYRAFDYDLALRSSGTGAQLPIKITGRKRLAWNTDPTQRRLWNALTQFDASFTFGDVVLSKPAKLYVDMDYLLDDGLLAVPPTSSNVPHAVFNCLAYSTRMARASVETSFWEFGAPDYPTRSPARHLELPESIAGAKRVSKELTTQDGAKICVHSYRKAGARTHRANREQPGRDVVLLVHGLAQGSLIYAHRELPTSMAKYFLAHEHDYDVWLLDFRLSTQIEPRNRGDWSIDEIAEHDIPLAIETVLGEYAKQAAAGEPSPRLHVFAHCVGAVAMSMGILSGAIEPNRLASVALNAIHPWIMPSPYNQVRAKLGNVFGNFIDDDTLDPIIQTKATVTPLHSVLDRLAYSFAHATARERHADPDAGERLADGICDRMTLMYGRMWRHANTKGIHDSWIDLVGKAPAAVYRHLYYLIVRERVVDREGMDRYIGKEQMARWSGIRTLFLHGEESEVFNPQSATRSAIRLSESMAELQDTRTPVKLRRIPDFGHMDPILADNAASECFNYLEHFFAGHFDHSDVYQVPDGPKLTLDRFEHDDDRDARTEEKIHCGPVLRSARVQDGAYVLRYWVELPTGQLQVPELKCLVPELAHATPVPQPEGIEKHFAWFDASYAPTALPRGSQPWAQRLAELAYGELSDCHFIVGSCCYPGSPFDRPRSDEAYGGIARVLDSGEPCDALFLLGDQIYADATAGLFDAMSWRDRYEERYWAAFNMPRAAEVLRRIPTHFAIDDHEIANDFAGVEPTASTDRTQEQRFAALGNGAIDQRHLDFAKQAASSYMGTARDAALPKRFWYELAHGVEFSCPAFVMDTRTERQRADFEKDVAAQLCSREQLDALLDWLYRVRELDQPKFIFSGSVIAPLKQSAHAPGMWMREDGLAAYPDELDEIIDHILEYQIQNVVFVGGDVHLSCTAELTLRDRRSARHRCNVRALQIVSSGLYAPLPFANLGDAEVKWEKESSIPLRHSCILYVPKRLGRNDAPFVKVAAAPDDGAWKIQVTGHDRDGRVCGHSEHVLPLRTAATPCTCTA